MVEKTAKRDWFNWWLLFCAAIGALILFLPLTIYAYDIGEILYIAVVAPIIALILLVTAIVIAIQRKTRKSFAVLSMFAVYCAVTFVMFKESYNLRSSIRWFFGSKNYKTEVLKLPNSANGGLKHIEWDGWGFGGNDTYVYLVFDPTNTLSAAAKNHSSGRFTDALCGVSRVRRLESHWYSIVFYTDTGWGQCN